MKKINQNEVSLPLVNRTTAERIGRQTPYWVLAVALIITVAAWWQTSRHFKKLEHERFSNRIAQIRSKIDARMLQYEQVLRSGVALHESSTEVTRQDWKMFVEKCEVQKWFPGIQAIGFAVPVQKAELASFEARIRDEGFVDFHVKPTKDRKEYTAIKYIEPFDWRNKRAFGYDMYSNPARRKAMDRAVATGTASISGKITLVQETDKDVQAGILCYLPLYETGAERSNVTERQQALKGWIYAAFRCDDLMAGILGDNAKELRLEIYDDDNIVPDQILFDSQSRVGQPGAHWVSSRGNRVLSEVVPIELSGRDWTLRLSSQPGFFSKSDAIISSLVGLGGTLISFLLFVVLISITRQREKAMQLARRMTTGLRESELHNRAIVENASEAILTVKPTGEISAANRASHLVFRSEKSLTGERFDRLIADADLDEIAYKPPHKTGLELGVSGQGRRIDGEVFPCRVSADRVESNDNTYFVVIVRDQTARVEAAAKLAEQNKKLVDASHRAGKAEVATGVLHNVGNVLNSVNVSSNMLKQRIEASPHIFLAQASEVIEENKLRMAEFFQTDDQGKHFPRLLKQLTNRLIKERECQLEEIDSLTNNINHIKEIVSMQQASTKRSGVLTRIVADELFEDAIKLNDSEWQWYTTKIVKDFSHKPTLNTRRHDVIQILVNLIRNSNQSIETAENEKGEIRLSIREVDECVEFAVSDTGIGIAQENIENIFQHGFTTKAEGNGFGLHSCANAAQQLGGSLKVHSDGVGKGATFTLCLPLDLSKLKEDETTSESSSDCECKTALPSGKSASVPIALMASGDPSFAVQRQITS